ncbi:MAG: hypothetical protein LBM08_08730 [Dysgonamonadaceae bacterium]|jgi:hypothetical protein|nr:hypothetical protein [Dysgonamonadaceae bacterium]
MKSLDLISKRILVISLSITAVLLSASLLIFSVRPANAQSPSFSSRMDDGRRYDAVAVNTAGGNATSYGAGYFLIWNTQTGTCKVMRPSLMTDFSEGGIYNSTETFW